MQNVLTAPGEPKFRRLRLTNARIAALVEAAPGARHAMEALGWLASIDGEGAAVLELPPAVSLEPIAAAVQALPGEAPAAVPAASIGEPWTVTVLRGPLRTKLELHSGSPVSVLAEAIEQNAALGRIHRGRQSLLVGYPPRPLTGQREDGTPATLEELNLRTVMLQDAWEDLCEELRNERTSFVQLAEALSRPALAALALRESRDFVAERARARLRQHTLRMPVEEMRIARCILQLLWTSPDDAATRRERLTFCAECAAATALRGAGASGAAGGGRPGEDDSSDEGEPLALVVERMSILESALPQIGRASARELRQPLEVRFANEAAEDAGGPRREFFNEFGRAAAAAHGLWRLTPAGSLVPTPTAVSSVQVPDSSLRHDFYRSCGRVCGMALHHTSRPPCHPMLIGLPLAQSFVRALQGNEPQSLEELQAELNAEQHESAPDFRGSVAFRSSSLRDLGLEGQLSFCYQDTYGCVVDLIPDGRKVIVTDETKESWLQATLRYELVQGIEEAVSAFRMGVCEVLGGAHLVLLSARELSEMWSGRGVITDVDLTIWQSKTEISPAITTQAGWFFELLSGELSQARGRVLKFATGSDRWPVDASGFTFTIEPMDGGDDKLPVAMTCGNMLQLPRYSRPGSLRDRLLKAVDLGMELQRT